jgi:hypothetical protein
MRRRSILPVVHRPCFFVPDAGSNSQAAERPARSEFNPRNSRASGFEDEIDDYNKKIRVPAIFG